VRTKFIGKSERAFMSCRRKNPIPIDISNPIFLDPIAFEQKQH